ncbi:hypothetical protein TNCV_3117521 [Trichonephila clavipes]|uniref:Uncharacterized protein n=1 Tax=Trichonephila clavipes TaxID=2585209 RepID=A0A8X6W959_TRICX|nr:hypothetical protein TNCV_3117521 [Trichonephila clavipes]
MADKNILECVQSSKQVINADSDDENEMNNAAPRGSHVIRNEEHHEKHALLFRSTFQCLLSFVLNDFHRVSPVCYRPRQPSGYGHELVDDVPRFGILVAAVAEWYRFRIVACLVTSSSPVPLKTRRVEQR